MHYSHVAECWPKMLWDRLCSTLDCVTTRYQETWVGLCKFISRVVDKPSTLETHRCRCLRVKRCTCPMQGSTASMLTIFQLFPLRNAALAITTTFHSLRSLFAKTLTLLLPTSMAFASPLRTTDPKRLPKPLPKAKAPGPFDIVQTYKRYVKDSNVSHCPPRMTWVIDDEDHRHLCQLLHSCLYPI